jgi:aminopeptidase-like protein
VHDAQMVGDEMYRLIRELYPICRSITGEGVRETLRTIQKRIPLVIEEVSTGEPALDWSVPREWNIRDAYVRDPSGRKVIDFAASNLHVMSYSVPVRRRMPLSELRPHLVTLPEHPDWIPYRTSYYQENWAFCLRHRTLEGLGDGEYEVVIDSSLENGHLSYGEYFIAGATADEVLVSTHICHPSLCNDNLSGIALATALAEHLSRATPRRSYRFLFLPGTIGSLTWLSRNERVLPNVKHGLVLANVGDPGPVTYKKSRRGDAEIDRIVTHVLKRSGAPHAIEEFTPYGYDERQFCSPGFDLPIGCFMRTAHGRYAEYHTSADDLGLVRVESLADSYAKLRAVVRVLEENDRFLNRNPKGEPQLGRRGLYRAVGGHSDAKSLELALLWVLNLSDGQHSLLDISERSGLSFDVVKGAADTLLAHALLGPAESSTARPSGHP